MGLTVEKCLQAWTNSLRHMNAKADIVFFGDSLTYYGDFSSVFPDKVVCNLGLRGDTIQGMIDRVEQVALLEPKVVFLMGGINDVGILPSNVFEKCYETLLLHIIKQANGAKIFVQSMLPVNNKQFSIGCNNEQILKSNILINLLCVRYELSFIDLYSLYINDNVLPEELTIDGIHLYPSSYKLWKSVLCSLYEDYALY